MTLAGPPIPVDIADVGNRQRILAHVGIRDHEYAKAVPGHRYLDGIGWHYPLSWSSCVGLRGVFGGRLEVGPALSEWAANERSTRIEPCMRLKYSSDAPGNEDMRPYQRVGINFMAIAKRAILADDMGTGKTAQTIRTIKTLHELGYRVFPALIITPAGVRRQWLREFVRWWGSGVPGVAIVEGDAQRRREAINRVATGEAGIAIINWENLRSHSRLAPYGSVRLRRCQVCDPEGAPAKRQASCHYCPKELNAISWRTVVADEVHRARDPETQWTRAYWHIAHGDDVEFSFGLTGTPVDDTIDEMWSIMHAVVPDEYPNKTAFIERYALQTWNMHGGRELVGIRPDTRDEFFAFYDPRVIRRPKAVALPWLPKKTRVRREVPLTRKQRQIYDELVDEMIARLDDGETLSVFDPLTATTRLNQAAASNLVSETCAKCEGSGQRPDYHPPAPHPDPQYAHAWCWCAEPLEDAPVHEPDCRKCNGRGLAYVPTLPSNKLDELETVLSELGSDKQAVVFAVSRRLLELASERLEKRDVSHVMITGSVPHQVREANKRAFMEGEARLILITIDAGGEGLDGLQTATDTAIFLQRHYRRLANVQAEDRVHRSGLESSTCVIIDIVSEETIENDKEVRLALKEDRFQELVRDAETLRRILSSR